MSAAVEAATDQTSTDAGTPAAGDAPVTPDAVQGQEPAATATEATDAAEGKTATLEEVLEQNRKKNSENKSLRATNKELASQLEEFNAWKESQKSDEQKAQEAQEALVAENAALKAQILRSGIQADLGLPAEIVELLQGETEEELRAHAEKLKPLFAAKDAAPAPKTPVLNPGQQVISGSQDPHARAAQALFGHIL